MKRRCLRLGSIRAALLLGTAVALANSGCCCLLVGAGVAGVAGGAGTGYAYCKGKVCETYHADFEDAWAATRTALADLGLPVVKEKHAKGFLESRTAQGKRVRLYVKAQPSKLPAEGPLTRVCVRVAVFGDQAVSARLLDQVGRHLVPVHLLGPPLAPSPSPGPVQPAAPAALPPQTAAPPLSPAEAGPQP
jgi:hypothetical protein